MELDPPDAQEAERAAREAVRARPSYHYSHYQLARALRLQGRFDEAVAAAEQSVLVTSDFAGGYRLLGQIHRDQGEYRDALVRFEEAYRLRPSSRELINRASAHVGLGEVEEALSCLEEALAAGFTDVEALRQSEYFEAVRDDSRFQALLETYEGESSDLDP